MEVTSADAGASTRRRFRGFSVQKLAFLALRLSRVYKVDEGVASLLFDAIRKNLTEDHFRVDEKDRRDGADRKDLSPELLLRYERGIKRQFLAAASVAEEDWELVADEFAAAFDEDRRTTGETCVLLLAAIGRGASHTEAIWHHDENDRGAAAAEWVTNHQQVSSGFSKALEYFSELRSGKPTEDCQRVMTVLNQLDQLQRMRLGQPVPPPVKVELST